MTDNDIINDFTRCLNGGLCSQCGHKMKLSCAKALMRNVLDLVKRLKAENESLKKSDFYVIRGVRGSGKTQFIKVKINCIKTEAFKEFAEAFKVKFAKERYRDNYVVDDEMLDNLVKEMTAHSLLDKKFGGDT